MASSDEYQQKSFWNKKEKWIDFELRKAFERFKEDCEKSYSRIKDQVKMDIKKRDDYINGIIENETLNKNN